MRVFTIYCQWDDEAKVWYVADSDVPGLVGEAATVEEMGALLQHRVPELLRLNLPADVKTLPREQASFKLVAERSDFAIACG